MKTNFQVFNCAGIYLIRERAISEQHGQTGKNSLLPLKTQYNNEVSINPNFGNIQCFVWKDKNIHFILSICKLHELGQVLRKTTRMDLEYQWNAP